MLVKNAKCPLGKTHHIRGGSRKLGKSGPSAGRHELLGGSRGMLPGEILKSRPSKTVPALDSAGVTRGVSRSEIFSFRMKI